MLLLPPSRRVDHFVVLFVRWPMRFDYYVLLSRSRGLWLGRQAGCLIIRDHQSRGSCSLKMNRPSETRTMPVIHRIAPHCAALEQATKRKTSDFTLQFTMHIAHCAASNAKGRVFANALNSKKLGMEMYNFDAQKLALVGFCV